MESVEAGSGILLDHGRCSRNELICTASAMFQKRQRE